MLCYKRRIKIWDVNVDNIVISKLVKTKINSMYFIGYLDKIIRPLVLIMPEDVIECESFTVINIDSLLVYDKKYYLRVYLHNYKIVNKQMTDYLDENLFED